MKAYTAKFGNPKSAENKKKGHKVVKVSGFRGVAVPGTTEKDVPWELERKYTDGQNLTAVEDEVGDGESEDFEGQLQDKFDDLANDDQNSYEKNVVGLSFEEIMKQAAAEEEAGEEVDAAAQARADMKRVTVGTAAADGDASDDQDALPRHRRSLRAESSNEDHKPSARGNTKGKKGGATATPPKVTTKPAASVRPRVASAVVAAKGQADIGNKTKPGTKATDLVAYSSTLMDEFKAAADDSVFFNPSSSCAQTRSITRYQATFWPMGAPRGVGAAEGPPKAAVSNRINTNKNIQRSDINYLETRTDTKQYTQTETYT